MLGWLTIKKGKAVPNAPPGHYVRYISHKNGFAKAKAFRGITVVEKVTGAELLGDVDFFFDENDGQDDGAETDCTADGEGEGAGGVGGGD